MGREVRVVRRSVFWEVEGWVLVFGECRRNL